ncbi:hypothetical protein [Streptomyces sp. NPDC054961]
MPRPAVGLSPDIKVGGPGAPVPNQDAILASPARPGMAAVMDRLQGVDVTRLLTDARRAGVGVDQAVAAVLAAPPAAGGIARPDGVAPRRRHPGQRPDPGTCRTGTSAG